MRKLIVTKQDTREAGHKDEETVCSRPTAAHVVATVDRVVTVSC